MKCEPRSELHKTNVEESYHEVKQLNVITLVFQISPDLNSF